MVLFGIILMVPLEDQVSITKIGYPPFTSTHVEAVEQAPIPYAGQVLSDKERAQMDLKSKSLANTTIMGLLFLIPFGRVSYLEQKMNEKKGD